MKKRGSSCPVCHRDYTEENPRTRHHILPKRFFFGVGGLYELCRDCHNKLEFFIPLKTKLLDFEYKRILDRFVRNYQNASH